MKLADYLERHQISRSAFAEKVRVTPGLVTQWIDGTTWLGRDVAQRVVEATSGAVTPNDFLPEAEAAK